MLAAALCGCAPGPSGPPSGSPLGSPSASPSASPPAWPPAAAAAPTPAGPPGAASRSAPATPPATAAAPGGGATARQLLATLPVKGRAPRTGYRRELFGQRWADTDRNGCDTRNDVLRRDLADTVLEPGTAGCVVRSGTLTDPFSGTTVRFRRGERTSAQVQVDHVVALSDAWQKGARAWSPRRRVGFANDPLNLLTVRGELNAAKGDGDAATWLPPERGSRCGYVARQVAVKARYGLWVTAAERDAVARVLQRCPDQPVPVSSAPTESDVGAVTPPAEPAPDSGSASAPGSAACDPSYTGACIPPLAVAGDLDCADVDARGVAVVGADPHRLDRDGDGVACEG